MQAVNEQGPMQGFTLIEMIAVILIMGAIGAAVAVFLGPAVRGYQAQTQRAVLVDGAESALRRMARDVRIALPNSVRVAVGPGFAIEMIPTIDGGRYCAVGLAACTDPAVPNQVVHFTAADTEFDILGLFRNPAFTAAAGGVGGTAVYQLVIGHANNEVYVDTASPGVITPAATNIRLTVSGSRHHVQFGGGASHQFRSTNRSPRERIFVIRTSDAPVSYLCDTAARTLTRYSGYAFQPAQPTTPGTIGVPGAVVVNNVTGCSLGTTTAASVQSTGIVIVSITLTSGGESVTLMHQAELDNNQ
jgi:MSHA biogenesis protein MshO